jgi:hypothetical protein
LFEFTGIWHDVLGDKLTKTGVWLIWGAQKNGKTSLALMLANYLSEISTVWYISAEEGLDEPFKDNCKRMKISHENRTLKMNDYVPLETLRKELKKTRCPKIIFIDNFTIYKEEMKTKDFTDMVNANEDKLFVFLAHEDRGEPYTAPAKLAWRLAKAIFYVKGLACLVSGRVPGGAVMIDEVSAKIFYGNSIN